MTHPSGGNEPPELPPRNGRDPLMESDSAVEVESVQDGRVDVNLDSAVAKKLAEIIYSEQGDAQSPPPEYSASHPGESTTCDLKLNIVIQIVGSRGDVQPFIALGNALQKCGHRVRIATHDNFADFVHDSGLEFYPIGGDPAELMAFMVKNPGLIPQMKSLREGEVQKKQAMQAIMLEGCWKSCIDDDPVTKEPFFADAIIANPPSFAHIHCAQALSIPVHLMFTMPWSSTKAFPHPLANLRSSSMDPQAANWVSYKMVEWLIWQGFGDLINRWRRSIGLSALSSTQGPCLAESLKVPFTYCWSPTLVPKPRDWSDNIDICGFFFRDTPSYSPPTELSDFLQRGSKPVYIGFGSIVVDDPQKLTDIILTAISRAGVRAIVSKGWSDIGGGPDENIYYIDDCPHEWLFQHVAAVVHHGGAGTTACGLRNGKPTAIVPFFGDQPFWGEMIARTGAGPRPTPYKSLDVEKLTAAIRFCLTPGAVAAAQEISERMEFECGVDDAVESFHRHLPLDKMRCSMIPGQVAAWKYQKGENQIHLSSTAVQFLIDHRNLNEIDFQPYPANKIVIEHRRWDPVTGVLAVAASTGSTIFKSTGEMLYNPYKEYKEGVSSGKIQPVRLDSFSNSSESEIASQSETSLPLDDTPKLRSSSSLPLPVRAQTIDGLSVAGSMIFGTMKGVGKLTGSYYKGLIVDIPHAAAEGFRQVPRLYGEEPKDYGGVHDWRSGFEVGGRNFVDGMTEGLSGILTKPAKGVKDGPLGAAKGLAKGYAGAATKLPSAGIGLVAYPFEGISKSIAAIFRPNSEMSISEARRKSGRYNMRAMDISPEQRREILEKFDTQAFA